MIPVSWLSTEVSNINSIRNEFADLFDCSKKYNDIATSSLPANQNSCSSSLVTVNGKQIQIIKDTVKTKHMELWISSADTGVN